MDSSIAVQPDIYGPIVNSEGNYIDKIPSQNKISVTGIRCPCSIKKETIFWTRSQFTAHTKTKTHQNWLCELSLSNINYYTRVQELEKITKEQKIMIGRLERDVKNRDITIFTLTQQLSSLSIKMNEEKLIENNDYN